MAADELALPCEPRRRAPSSSSGTAGRIVLLVAIPVLLAAAAGAVYLLARGAGPGNAGSTPSTANGSGVRDSFDRSGDARSLGTSTSGHSWKVVSGTWGIDDGAATLLDANDAGPRSLAVVDMGGRDGVIRATAAKMSPGWGLVFRYRGPFNYWYITAAPEAAAYNIVRVSQSSEADEIEVETVTRLELATAADGVVVEIRVSGALVEIVLDGVLRYQLIDDILAGESGVGLIAVGEARGGRWDDFVAFARAPAVRKNDPATQPTVSLP